jgi:hypothetical protein
MPIYTLLARRWDNRPAQLTVRRQTPHIAHQLDARQGHERGLLGHALAPHDGDDMHRRARFRDQAQRRSPSQVPEHPGVQRSVGCWRNPAGDDERRAATLHAASATSRSQEGQPDL